MSTHNLVLSKYKKNNVYHCKLQFFYIKVGFKGVKIIQGCFRDVFKSPLLHRHLFLKVSQCYFSDLSGTQFRCLNKSKGPAVWVCFCFEF